MNYGGSDTKHLTEKKIGECFFGSVTVGERGQVVIPAEARKVMGIVAGDHLLVLGSPLREGLVFTKLDTVQQVIASFNRILDEANEASTEESPEETS